MSSVTRFLSSLTAAAALTSSGTSLPAAGVSGQGRERVVVLKDDFNPPVTIKDVKVDNRPVKSGEKSLADDDWLEGFSVSVKNETAKPIISIGVDVFFLRPKEQAKEPPYVYELDYNLDPFRLEPGEGYPLANPPIPPGGTVDIYIPADWYNHIKSSLIELGYPWPHKGIEIRLESLGFDDGTMWHTGTYYRRDPTAPSGWKEIDKPRGSARKGAANFFAFKPTVYKLCEPTRILTP